MTDVLEISGLTKRFRSVFSTRAVEAVRELDITVDRGSVVAFVGPNGAGKTTTLLTILGFLKPDSGHVRVFGEPAGSVAARRRIGFQSEIFYTYPFHTARRALTFYGRLSAVPRDELQGRVEAKLEQLGIAHAADRKVATFSKGMMQRLGLAQALVHEPDLLLLDEPTTGLDPEGRKLVADIIADEKSKGRTIFLSSHILTDVERSCDRVVMIRQGSLVLSKEIRESSLSELWEIDLVSGGAREGAFARLTELGFSASVETETVGSATFLCSGDQKAELLRAALDGGLDVAGVRRQEETLEDLYMKLLGGSSNG